MASDQSSTTIFPTGELFEPLIAAVKEAQFSVGIHHVDIIDEIGDFTGAMVSFGEYFGLVRWDTVNKGQWQRAN